MRVNVTKKHVAPTGVYLPGIADVDDALGEAMIEAGNAEAEPEPEPEATEPEESETKPKRSHKKDKEK